MERNKKSVKRRLIDDLKAGTSGTTVKENLKKSKVMVAMKGSQQTNVRNDRNDHARGKKTTSSGVINKKTVSKARTKKVLGNNNNAAIAKKNVLVDTSVKNVGPIIQTRSMNAKSVLEQSEMDKLNKIDALTSTEFANGDEFAAHICHDGVVLSIGSDLEEEFPEPECPEAGEVFSSDEEITTITTVTTPSARSNNRE